MVRKYCKIYILIILAGFISIISKTAFLSSSGQARNPGQLYIDILQAPAKTGDNQLMTAEITENEFPVNVYTRESPDFDGLTGCINYERFSGKYLHPVYLSANLLLLRQLIISELDLPPPLLS
jgi:hypothetical protein